MSESQDQEARISAGEQLKALREQKNMSVKDIAAQLNLEARVIEAIEENNFDALPAATYARGYLRSYAKILDADPDTIIASYNPDAAQPPEIIPEVKHTTQTSSTDKPVQAFTYLITLTLVILLIAWWQSNNIILSTTSSSDAVDDIPPPGLGYDIPVIEHSNSPFFHVEEIPDAVEENESSLPTDIASIEDADMPELGSYPSSVTSDNQGPDSIILKVSADSWVEIFDAEGNKVFLNLAREGQTLSLRGVAPFSVILGFANGISVEFNGQQFDTTPFTKSSIARFSLGQE